MVQRKNRFLASISDEIFPYTPDNGIVNCESEYCKYTEKTSELRANGSNRNHGFIKNPLTFLGKDSSFFL